MSGHRTQIRWTLDKNLTASFWSKSQILCTAVRRRKVQVQEIEKKSKVTKLCTKTAQFSPAEHELISIVCLEMEADTKLVVRSTTSQFLSKRTYLLFTTALIILMVSFPDDNTLLVTLSHIQYVCASLLVRWQTWLQSILVFLD